MTIGKRIRMCLLIERLNENREFVKILGIEDVSQFHGKRIDNGGIGEC